MEIWKELKPHGLGSMTVINELSLLDLGELILSSVKWEQ